MVIIIIIIIIIRGLDNEPLKAVGQIDKDFPSPIIKKLCYSQVAIIMRKTAESRKDRLETPEDL